VIAVPFNDLTCLGTITDEIASRVEQHDQVLVDIAAKYKTTDALVEWIRSLPQRNDDGDKHDGPRIEACEPTQRLRVPAKDPNCVERAALYIAVAELIDAHPVRQLATLDTAVGLHTLPLENGAPVILDPRVPRNCLDCSVALSQPGPIAVDARNAIEWTTQFGEAGATQFRNGPSRARQARNAITRLVDEGVAPADQGELDLMAWFLALAENTARHYGDRVLALVKTVALAISEMVDQVLAQPRNARVDIVFDPARLVSGLGRVAARVGVDLGTAALRSQLQLLGISGPLLGLVEEELNAEGLTLGPLARPHRFQTRIAIAPPRVA
jgi:hypothetical protein